MDESVAECGIAGWGVVRSAPAEIVHLRKHPLPLAGKPPVSQLKLVDEQAVLATTAVLRAIDTQGWHERSFADWAVVSAPRYLGRLRGAAMFHRYRRIGLPAVSPLAIPTLSLHAIAGTVGLVLGSHGPNFGVGGGPNHLTEGLWTSLSLLHDQCIPGVWLVASCFDPEPIPDDEGKPQTPTVGYGVALALKAAADCQGSLCFESHPKQSAGGGVPSLADFLEQLENPAQKWYSAAAGGVAATITATATTVWQRTMRRAG